MSIFDPYRTAASAASVHAAVDALVSKHLGGAKSEPQAVYNLFCGAPALADWAQLLAAAGPGNTPISYNAVFVHQRPRVTFAGGSCELADVLVSVAFPGLERRHAAIFQAKMGATWPPPRP